MSKTTYEMQQEATTRRDAALQRQSDVARRSSTTSVPKEAVAVGIEAANAVTAWAQAMREHALEVEASFLGINQGELDDRELAAIADFHPDQV